ncbi:hypothetical protein C2845_PM09G13650 [Panicum miliaceum]|uniref:Uncharacterized protein n=1 Tax=Panicum miliaceum TaxID=4540 RepID=A0A3L6S2B0_PANMI|nr:hypothetical protein C2845_PM09G13650 [Panicum miliaceum]
MASKEGIESAVMGSQQSIIQATPFARNNNQDSNKRVGSVLYDLEVAHTLLANLTLEDLEE